MEVILLENIDNLGALGDKVSVRAGYARNYLIPQGKAKFATAQNIAEFEAQRAELEQTASDALVVAEARRERLDGMEVTIAAKAGSEGKLFGSVGTADIAEAITEAGVEVQRREVRLPTGALRVVGEHDIDIHLHTDVDAAVKVKVVAEE